ncbi:MAG: hypothetical protein P8Y71_14180 [Pseudolabrys sp.]|jgi:hypothetical protein
MTIDKIDAELNRASAALDAATDHETAIAVLDRITALTQELIEVKARSLDDLCAKARATAWAIEYEYGFFNPAKEMSENNRIAASIVRDLLEIGSRGASSSATEPR